MSEEPEAVDDSPAHDLDDCGFCRLRAEVARLRAVVEQVRALHGNSVDPTECMECDHHRQSGYHPCRTLELLALLSDPVSP